jgi:hypothetical protein
LPANVDLHLCLFVQPLYQYLALFVSHFLDFFGPFDRILISCSSTVTNQQCKNPVFTKDGRVYERGVIEKHIAANGTDPFSNQPMSNDDLIAVVGAFDHEFPFMLPCQLQISRLVHHQFFGVIYCRNLITM